MAGRAIKIVSYNILDGGLGRLDPIYETLLYLDADIVGLCEADDEKGVRYLADKLGMDYVSAGGSEGGAGRGVALLSRGTIRQMVNLSVKHTNLEKRAMEAVVEIKGSLLRVAVVHLEAGQYRENEEKRLSQLEAVLGELNGERMPTVLMGDFNAAAPYHPFDYEAASPKIKARLAERGVRDLDHDVVKRIAGAGWIDAYHAAKPRTAKHTFTTGFPATRYDYIWLSEDVAARLADADVEQGGFAPYCSDHYPIWATLHSDRSATENAP